MDEAQVYTVRLWRHAGEWRAAVRAVGEEASQLFTEPAQLAAWLHARSAAPLDTGTPAPPKAKAGRRGVVGQR